MPIEIFRGVHGQCVCVCGCVGGGGGGGGGGLHTRQLIHAVRQGVQLLQYVFQINAGRWDSLVCGLLCVFHLQHNCIA